MSLGKYTVALGGRRQQQRKKETWVLRVGRVKKKVYNRNEVRLNCCDENSVHCLLQKILSILFTIGRLLVVSWSELSSWLILFFD